MNSDVGRFSSCHHRKCGETGIGQESQQVVSESDARTALVEYYCVPCCAVVCSIVRKKTHGRLQWQNNYCVRTSTTGNPTNGSASEMKIVDGG